ncbi:MAG: hypothetical protein ACQEXJ_15015 [Myxococcota bacterium]
MFRKAPVRAMLVALFAAGVLAGGCRSMVGDSCEADSDCGRGLFCEQSLPGGYCTIDECVDDACPDEAVCVRFDAYTDFCMRACDGDGDCRDDYACVQDFGPHPFCHAFEPPVEEGEN